MRFVVAYSRSLGPRKCLCKLFIQLSHAYGILSLWDIQLTFERWYYGGHGYGHLLENVVPKMKDRGISEDNIITSIITGNPQQWITFV